MDESTTGGRAAAAETLEAEPDRALMERNGITRVTTYQYRVDGYRYTQLTDALAQVARRSRAEAGARPAA